MLRVLTSICLCQFGKVSVALLTVSLSFHLSVENKFVSFIKWCLFVCTNIKIDFCLSDDFNVNVEFRSRFYFHHFYYVTEAMTTTVASLVSKVKVLHLVF